MMVLRYTVVSLQYCLFKNAILMILKVFRCENYGKDSKLLQWAVFAIFQKK